MRRLGHNLFRACGPAIVLAAQAQFATAGDWTIVASYPLPEGASGLAFDGTNLYCGIYGVNGSHIYRINPADGSYALQFAGPQEDAFGLTYDGTWLWTTDHPGSSSTPAQALRLGWDGSILDAIDLPDHYMSGIAYDNGELWVARYYPDPGHLYRIDMNGQVLDEFDGPDDQPWDIAIHDDMLWVADYWGDRLDQLDRNTGAVIASHASEDIDPAGVVWDGQHLWYCDNGGSWDEDRLYKVDIAGGGTPVIDISQSSHDFGVVTIGTTAIWTMSIANTGDAALVIDSVVFEDPDLNCPSILPMTIDPGQTRNINIQWTPGLFGLLDTTGMIVSNDPINGSFELQFAGHGVYPGPALHLGDSGHMFNDVRLGASSRWVFEVINHGDQLLEIDAITSNQSVFTIDATLPIVLDTLETAFVGVWFTPTGTPLVLGELTLYSSDPNSPDVVTLGGTGVEATWPIGSQLWSYQITGGWDNTPKAMAPIEDVGGDGLADVIVCSEDGFIRCFHGNASGHGDVLWEHEIYSGPVYSGKGLDIVEDRDGDGVQEIVVGTTGGARLVRMLSGASGSEIWTFQTNIFGDGGWVYQVDGSRDFTGDGIRDVIACAGDDGDDSGPKRVWCLDGLTGVPLWDRPVGGPAFAALAIDDMTGDGVPDVLAGASDQWEIQGAAYGIDGSNGAVQWTVETSGSSVWALAQVGDVDGDSVRDVMVGDFGSGEILILDAVYGSVLASTSVGAFLTGFQVMEDVSGDGLPDIAIEYFSNTARVLDGATCATVWSTPVADSPSVCAPIPDISGDGINDLIVGTLFSNNRGYALDGVSGAILVEMSFGTPIDSVAVMPDVVGDGSWEFLLGGRDGNVFCFSGGLDAIALDPADINQDGMVDVKDLLILLGDWGQSGSPADINGDGIVGVEDILQLLAAWNAGG